MFLRRSRKLEFFRASILLLVVWPGVAEPVYSQVESNVSVELRQLFEADQADRRFAAPPTPEEWSEIVERDKLRQERVLELVRADLLAGPDDYYHAAMVLQHGEGAEPILLAHILATAAGFSGHEEARWLSAASLDRYLHRTRQPQRLGTQYVRVTLDEPFRITPHAPWSQGAYVRWLPDSIRAAFGVPSLADQAATVERMNSGSGR